MADWKFGSEKKKVCNRGSNESEEQPATIMDEKIRNHDENTSRERQLRFEALENGCNFGENVDRQDEGNTYRRDDDDRRIHESTDYLLAQRILLLKLLG